jgi:succinoglycan biosynthesis protein ExoM
MSVSVVIPTFRRPESLERALRSVLTQAGVEGELAEVVVVDNAPEGGAGEVVDRLRPEATIPLVYVHESRPGVATARNAGLTAARGDLIAFLDDDEEAPPSWLAALLAAHREHGADVTFGAIRGRAPDAPGWAAAYLERLFSRAGPAAGGLIADPYGCGNSLLTRATCLADPAPFDSALDETGGEDDVLFERLRQEGRRFAWSPEAWVYEHAPAERATMRYALRRAFAYGQSPCQEAARRRDPAGIAKWMLVGLAQAGVYGLGAAALWMIRSPRRAELMDRAARGLGKVFWAPWFEPRFYGAAAVRRSGPVATCSSLASVAT